MKPRYAVAVDRARLQGFRHFPGMEFLIAVGSASPGHQRPYGNALPQAYPPCPLRSHKAFVAGKAEDVNTHVFHMDVKYPRCLGRIQDKQQGCLCADPSHPFNIHHISRKVGCMGTYDPLCVGPDGSFQVLIPYIPPAIGPDNGQLHSPLPHHIQGAEDGIVLHHGGDHMITR